MVNLDFSSLLLIEKDKKFLYCLRLVVVCSGFQLVFNELITEVEVFSIMVGIPRFSVYLIWCLVIFYFYAF